MAIARRASPAPAAASAGRETDTRDSSLRRLALVNRWLLAGSIALTGVLTEVAAQAFPGKAKTSSTTSRAHRGKAQTRSSTGARTSTAKTLAAPAKAPEATSETSNQKAESSSAAGSESSSSRTSESSSSSTEPSSEATHEASSSQGSAPVVSGGS